MDPIFREVATPRSISESSKDFNAWRKEKIRDEHKRLQLRPEVETIFMRIPPGINVYPLEV